jgi:hypothetical protein
MSPSHARIGDECSIPADLQRAKHGARLAKDVPDVRLGSFGEDDAH